MRTVAAFVIGLAVGIAALGGYLYSIGRIKTSEPIVERTATPTLPPPTLTIPTAQAAPLPPPPEVDASTPQQTVAKSGTFSTLISIPSIGLPIANLQKARIQDTFNDTRGGGAKHGATDIMEPRGTPVHAVVEGNVVKLFNSKKGGTTLYQYDNAQQYCYYYAHLDRYADGIKEGMLLRKGDVLGYVGSTGDANPANPHLHFEILQLGPDKHWYEHTVAINPYPILIQALGTN